MVVCTCTAPPPTAFLHIKVPSFSHSSEVGLNTASLQDPLELVLPLMHTIKPVQLGTVGSLRRVRPVMPANGSQGSGADVVVVVGVEIS